MGIKAPLIIDDNSFEDITEEVSIAHFLFRGSGLCDILLEECAGISVIYECPKEYEYTWLRYLRLLRSLHCDSCTEYISYEEYKQTYLESLIDIVNNKKKSLKPKKFKRTGSMLTQAVNGLGIFLYTFVMLAPAGGFQAVIPALMVYMVAVLKSYLDQPLEEVPPEFVPLSTEFKDSSIEHYNQRFLQEASELKGSISIADVGQLSISDSSGLCIIDD